VKYCMHLCPVGIGLKNLGDMLVNGETRKAKELDQETYERVSKKWTDREICKEYGISSTTLTRRKQKWGIINRYDHWKEKLTVEKYLSFKEMRLSDKEIAESFGIGTSTLKRWKAAENVYIPSRMEILLETKTKKNYLTDLTKFETDEEVAKQWGISERTLRRWKKTKGIHFYA
jgi:DNA-binding Xre family transcriptional regulator